MGIITLVLWEQGNQGMWRFNLLSRDIQSRTKQNLNLGAWYLTSQPLSPDLLPGGALTLQPGPERDGLPPLVTSTSQEIKLTQGRDADNQREELVMSCPDSHVPLGVQG